jgi:transposase-like protein
MPQKSVLSFEEKVKAVNLCIDGKESVHGCARKLRVSEETLRCWIRLYKLRGDEGLIPSSIKRKYSPELKILAVEEYLLGGSSLCEICAKYNVTKKNMVQKWVKLYNNHEDFNNPNSGGAIYMVKGRETTLEERIEIVGHCIANNKDYGKTIEKYSVSYQQIYGWVKKYEAGGVDALIDRRGKRKDEASMTEVERLQAQLKLKEAENLRLQMENDLLKKLEALERGIGED